MQSGLPEAHPHCRVVCRNSSSHCPQPVETGIETYNATGIQACSDDIGLVGPIASLVNLF